jgi:hypothetical protein
MNLFNRDRALSQNILPKLIDHDKSLQDKNFTFSELGLSQASNPVVPKFKKTLSLAT